MTYLISLKQFTIILFIEIITNVTFNIISLTDGNEMFKNELVVMVIS